MTKKMSKVTIKNPGRKMVFTKLSGGRNEHGRTLREKKGRLGQNDNIWLRFLWEHDHHNQSKRGGRVLGNALRQSGQQGKNRRGLKRNVQSEQEGLRAKKSEERFAPRSHLGGKHLDREAGERRKGQLVG